MTEKLRSALDQRKQFVLCLLMAYCRVKACPRPPQPWGGGGGGGLPYITDGDARRNFQEKPLKVTILGVALTNFIP